MQLIGKLLFAPRASLLNYCVLSFPAAAFPSAFFFGLAYMICIALGIDTAPISPPHREVNVEELFSAIVFAPIVETAILAGVIALMSRITGKVAVIASISAVLWGLLHATQGLLWFFGTAWSFFIFSAGYLAWRQVSVKSAFLAAAIPHALINASVMLLLWLASSAA